MTIKDKLIETFNNYSKSLNGEKNSYFFSLREKSIENFNKLGFPTVKNEEWKYTKVNFLFNNDFDICSNPVSSLPEKLNIPDFYIDNFDGNRLVFINGFFDSKHSNIVSNNIKLIITGLREAYSQYPDLVEKFIAKYTDEQKNPFTSLNLALATDGAFIYIPEGYECETPFHLLFINNSDNVPVMTHIRNLIVLEENSKAKFIETNYSYGKNSTFHNNVTEIYQLKNSDAEYYKFQNDTESSHYIGSTQIHQERDSRFYSTTISLGGKLVRNNLNTILDGENSEAHFNGLYFIGNEDFVDNHTLVDHSKPNCNSNENYKGIIDDKATAVFNGKILVRKDAQKTNAYQSNKNILLSNEATINTKPQLEIFADDVKCSHGATSGYLNKEALFYFRARGIDEKTAQSYLLNSFSAEIIETISIDALRDLIKSVVAKKLSMNELYFCSILETNKI